MLGAFCVQAYLAAIAGEPTSICLRAMGAADQLAFIAFARDLNRWLRRRSWN
jgi:hypothetical protein